MSTLIETYDHILGDTRTPAIFQIIVDSEPLDVTSLDVEFHMVSDAGVEKVAWTDVGAIIHDATAGKVEYTFAAGDVDTAGTYWGWFRVGTGNVWDTHPKQADDDGKARGWKIRITTTD